MNAALVLLLTAAAMAQTPAAATKPKSDVGTAVKDPTIDWYDSVADYFLVSRRAVMAIIDKGIPPEQVPAVLQMTHEARVSPNEVMAARRAGKSWADIAKQYNGKPAGDDFVTDANVTFLSQYHGQTPAEVRKLLAQGASVIDINEQFRRVGMPPMPRRTVEGERSRKR